MDDQRAMGVLHGVTELEEEHADLQIAATDVPDPVFPDGNITYTVTVTNAGPDATTNASMTAVNNTLQFQSVSAPAGWTCPALAVGHGGAFDCTAANLPTPSTSVFTIVLKAAQAVYGNSNQSINQVLIISSDWSDPVNANNSVNVTTAYVVPTANLAVTNSDSPDPVNSGATITYTQTLTNNGPDAAANARITELIPSGATFSRSRRRAASIAPLRLLAEQARSPAPSPRWPTQQRHRSRW
jgi:uncharacterized repeat protein (TIGR01451 family)